MPPRLVHSPRYLGWATGLLSALGVALVLVACEGKPAPESNAGAAQPLDTSATTSTQIDAAPTGQPSITAEVCQAAAATARPSVRWAASPGLTADLNYDGSSDLAVWGTEGDSLFVLAIVECGARQSGRVWWMPLRARQAFGTLDLDVSLVNPAFGSGYLQENCMGAETTSECRQLAALNTRLEAAYARGGRGLQIGVPDQHNVHLYWDSDSTRFVMWGL